MVHHPSHDEQFPFTGGRILVDVHQIGDLAGILFRSFYGHRCTVSMT